MTAVILTLPIFGDASDGVEAAALQPVRVHMIPGQSLKLGRNSYPGLAAGDSKCVAVALALH